MRSSRTALAIGVLFAGVFALLLWRYDPWVFGGAINHPFVTLFVAAGAVIFVVITIGYSVNDPKRAVIFKEGRFDRVEPGGRMLLWPGTEVGREVSLAGQRVIGWPILAYDQKGSEVGIVFGLTWRIVPSSTKPSVREQRMLLATNEERRRMVIQALESVIREIARATTVDNLKGVLTSGNCVEAIRQVVSAQLEEDALTVDQLHLVRFLPPEKKDEPVPVRNTKTVEETRSWAVPSVPTFLPPQIQAQLQAQGPGPIQAQVQVQSPALPIPSARCPNPHCHDPECTGEKCAKRPAKADSVDDGKQDAKKGDGKDGKKDDESLQSHPGEHEWPDPPRSGWVHVERTEVETRGERVKPDKKPDPNISCATCGLPVDPKAPAFTVRFCRQCGGQVTPCAGCGKQQGPCPSCGCPAN